MPAPALLAPADGQQFADGNEIILRWQPVGTLPRDAYYVVTLTYAHGGDTWTDETPWTRDTSWTASEHDYLLDLSDNGLFRWSVQVMLQTGVDANGRPTGVPISPSSPIWTFSWTRGGQGSPSTPVPTPTPPPP